MGKFLKAAKRGVRAIKAELGPREYETEDKKILCQHCGGALFGKGNLFLNARVAPLVGLDWADKSVVTLVCAHCGHVELFCKQPTRL
jgi:hypothetical protein